MWIGFLNITHVLDYKTSKPTEGEVPPAGCAGVVCANETNNKEMFST